MADNDQEKTEYQSQKKLEESRERGELPRSLELNTFAVFAIVLVFFSMTRLGWFESLAAIMTDLLRFDRHLNINAENLGEFIFEPALKAILTMIPLFGLILIISPLITLCQTGFNIAQDKLTPDWSKLDPVAGLRRIISLRAWIEGAKSCAKIGLFGWLAWGVINKRLPEIMASGALDLRAQVSLMMDVSLAIGARIATMMAILATLDFGYQWWEFQKRLRMTMQEMKDEMKEREGNPLIKQRMRSLAMQRLRQRMMNEVPKASVVVTNPTHFAVALTYNRSKASAPYVSAKGADFMAQRIKEIAREHGVPIVENKPLARALYRHVKVGQVIPGEFYKAVAEVLAFVFMLRQKRKSPPVHHVGRR